MSSKASDKYIIHVSAWAKAFTQYRMPLIRKLGEMFRRQIIYCPNKNEHMTRLTADGFETKHARISSKLDFGVFRQVWKLYRYLKQEKFDVIIAHQPMGALVGIPAARLAGVPVKIYSTGGLRHVSGQKGIFNLLMRYGELKIIKWSDAVFLVNKEDKAFLETIPYAGEKAFYVGPVGGCGIDTSKINPSMRIEQKSRARNELGIEDGEFVVGFVGRCVWEKGIKDLVDAAALLYKKNETNNVKFVVLGQGQHFREIVRYSEDKGVSSCFSFPGYKFNVHYYMAAFDAFVLPSYREGLPVSLLEAMALGIPSIATDVRGSRELIRDGETGLLVPVREPLKLAESIETFMGNPSQRMAFGKAASQFVADNFDEKEIVERTMDILEELVGKCERSRDGKAPWKKGASFEE